MSSIRRIRHNISKSKLRVPLSWLRHRGIHSNDVFIASYPRSGSTWARFMLFDILTGQSAEFETVNQAIPSVGKHSEAWQLLPEGGCLIQTHESYRSEYKRGIYLVRDVRDVVLSEHAYQKWRGIYRRELGDFLMSFLKGRVNGYGSWHNHVNSWLDAKLATKVGLLVVKFEDMRRDTEGALTKMLDFLGVEADAATIRDAIDDNSIQRMREKEDRARKTIFEAYRKDIRFVRKGSVRGWRQKLTCEQIELIERYAGESLTRMSYSLRSDKRK